MQYIGCLGAAKIAPKALCDPAEKIDGATLYTIAARDISRAKRFADKHKFEMVSESYDALIHDPTVTLVYNALPINLHATWTIGALSAGKHVLCEKPFAMNLAEAEAMLAAAQASGARVIEAFHYRYHPAFATMLDWISNGEIGDIQRIEAVFTVPISDRGGQEIRHLKETGGGAFMDLGCYPLHWVRSVMGTEPETIEADASLTPRGVDETLTAQLGFAGGAVADLSASMAKDTQFQARLSVTGSRGTILFENPLAPHTGARLVLDGPKGQISAEISRIPTYAYQLAAVIDGLERGHALPTEGEDTLAQQAAIDRIYASAGLAHLRTL
ncbi:MAG: Gfo/Idh/MocA family oxidoreductase [Pseudomonadota bacterium]